MRHKRLDLTSGFDVVLGNSRSEAAVMVLQAGEPTGGPDNRHEGSDQWLFVVEGEGTAIIEGEEIPLAKGSLLLIERGEAHEIRAGAAALRTLNFYVPPEYGGG